MKELKRIAFGEFIDDIQIAQKVTNFFGISTDKGDEVDEKVGTERLGSSDIFKSFGATLVIVSIGVVLMILLLIGVIILFRKYKPS